MSTREYIFATDFFFFFLLIVLGCRLLSQACAAFALSHDNTLIPPWSWPARKGGKRGVVAWVGSSGA